MCELPVAERSLAGGGAQDHKIERNEKSLGEESCFRTTETGCFESAPALI